MIVKFLFQFKINVVCDIHLDCWHGPISITNFFCNSNFFEINLEMTSKLISLLLGMNDKISRILLEFEKQIKKHKES